MARPVGELTELYILDFIKPGAYWPVNWRVPVFMKSLLCDCRYVCCVCVYASKAVNNFSCEMKPE